MSFERDVFSKAFDPLAKAPEDDPLHWFFYPRAIAVVGATERPGAVGRTCLANLLTDGYQGEVYPINPKRDSVLGIKAYKDLEDLPTVPDMVMIVTPDRTVPAIIGKCVDMKVPSCIIITAGFREVGDAGIELERQIEEHLKRGKGRTRVLGPNCVGMQNPFNNLNATFAQQLCGEGEIALISQSGAMVTSILDWALQNNVGFSYLISVGSMLDLGWADLLDYLGKDPRTKSIVLYMETIGDARSFLSSAREVTLIKPIVVLKAGRSEAAAAAAVSHTGSLAGSDAVLDMAFKRAGIVRVDSIEDMFELPKCLTKQPIPKGPRLCIVTNAGGPGVLATDSVVEHGTEMAKLSPETIEELNGILPPHWSKANPIDMIGSATHVTYAQTLDVALKADCDGILVIGVPVAQLSLTQLAQAIKSANAREKNKPILVAYQGGEEVEPGKKMLERSGIPVYTFADEACKMFSYMWRYQKSINSIYERPRLLRSSEDTDAKKRNQDVQDIIAKVVKEDRTVMTEEESKQVLKTYGIPVVTTEIALSEDEAVAKAKEIGYPVVIKIHSKTITHKSDVGGVVLNVQNDSSVRNAYNGIKENVGKLKGKLEENFLGVTVQAMLRQDSVELLLGANTDAQFGPVIVFGTGGFNVEVFKDNSLGLPPLNTNLADAMINETLISKALRSYRGRASVNMADLQLILTKFSRLIVENRRIKEFDINPILANEHRIVAVDARVVLHENSIKEEDIVPVAIRPYPVEYIKREIVKGREYVVRPLMPEDEPVIIDFNKSMSQESVIGYFKKDVPLEERISHERMVKICHADYSRVIALAAFDKETSVCVGVVRILRDTLNPNLGRFIMVIRDTHQKGGLGTMLISNAMDVAKAEKLEELQTEILNREITIQLPSTQRAQAMLNNRGFTLSKDDHGFINAKIKL